MGLHDDVIANARIGLWPPLTRYAAPTPEGCTATNLSVDETLAFLEDAIRECQRQSRRWRCLAEVYGRYHTELCHKSI